MSHYVEGVRLCNGCSTAVGLAKRARKARVAAKRAPRMAKEREVVAIHFKFKDRAIQLEVPMPHESETGTKAKADAATRQRWRALVLVIKAKLEAVASGISTLEQEFLANVVMANGQTIGQAILPRLSEAVSSGRLLPPAGGAT